MCVSSHFLPTDVKTASFSDSCSLSEKAMRPLLMSRCGLFPTVHPCSQAPYAAPLANGNTEIKVRGLVWNHPRGSFKYQDLQRSCSQQRRHGWTQPTSSRRIRLSSWNCSPGWVRSEIKTANRASVISPKSHSPSPPQKNPRATGRSWCLASPCLFS